MTKFAPVLLTIAGLALAGAASAATPAPATAPATKAPAASTKLASCKADWKAQKTHTGKEKDFLKACVAKG